jgi:hypothetical protein
MRRIALRHYGAWNSEVWQLIQKNNPGLDDPGRIQAGQILRLPGGKERR